MKFLKYFEKNIFTFLILAILIVIVFGRTINTLYQQDEWNGLGLVYADGIRSIFPGTFQPIDLIFVKGRLLSNLIFYFFASIFPLNNLPLAIFAIITHLSCTVLVFLLIKKLVNNHTASLLGAMFFAVNAVSHGAVTWSFVSINTIGSTLLVLVSTYFFINYLETNKFTKLLFSASILYLSLWFKETGLYLFALFPLIALYLKSSKLRPFLSKFWIFIVPFILIVGYRVIELRLRTTESNLYLTGNNESFFLTILIRGILYPLTSFSLMFVPGDSFINFAREVLRDNYHFFVNSANNLLISQSVILDLLAVVLTTILLFIIALLLIKEKAEKIKIVLFWLGFTFTSFLPYIVLSKDFSYLESRYYYLPAAGAAVIFSWVLFRIREVFGKNVYLYFVIPLSLIFIYWHINSLNKAIDQLLTFSGWRRNFIVQIKNIQPALLNKKNIFYVLSDKDYWADGNKLPFQQGSGYTLMVLYNNSGNIPKEFLKEGYLFDIGSQGYKEINGIGFGYYWNNSDLESAIKSNNLNENNVIRLKYDSKSAELTKL